MNVFISLLMWQLTVWPTTPGRKAKVLISISVKCWNNQNKDMLKIQTFTCYLTRIPLSVDVDPPHTKFPFLLCCPANFSNTPQLWQRHPVVWLSEDTADNPPRSKGRPSQWWRAWRCKCACCHAGQRKTPCPCHSPAALGFSGGSSSSWASPKARYQQNTFCGRSTRTGSRCSAPKTPFLSSWRMI